MTEAMEPALFLISTLPSASSFSARLSLTVSLAVRRIVHLSLHVRALSLTTLKALTVAAQTGLHFLLSRQDRRDLRIVSPACEDMVLWCESVCRALADRQASTSAERGVFLVRQVGRPLASLMSVWRPSAPYGEQKLAAKIANICRFRSSVKGRETSAKYTRSRPFVSLRTSPRLGLCVQAQIAARRDNPSGLACWYTSWLEAITSPSWGVVWRTAF